MFSIAGRFGKPAGPPRSPVIEAIIPRVKELMTEAAFIYHDQFLDLVGNLLSKWFLMGFDSLDVFLKFTGRPMGT